MNYNRGCLRAVRLAAAYCLLVFPALVGANLTTFQAEAGLLTDVTIKQTHAGYQGSGFADYSDRGGGSIQWTYIAPANGEVEISLRYATKNPRPLDLYIDGTRRLRFECLSTGSWSTWREENAVLNLGKGAHVLHLDAPFTGPNVDFLSVLSRDIRVVDPTASPTEAPIGTSGPSKQVYQAEATQSSNKISIQTTHPGYDGRGYADYGGQGGYLLWTVTVTKDADYDIQVKYAAANARKCNLYIDGRLRGTFRFGGTGSWNNWDYETLTVALTSGEHEVMILAEETTGPNIDWISVSSKCDGSLCEAPPPAPTPSPVVRIMQPTATERQPRSFPARVVVGSNQRIERGEMVSSPNGEFKAGLTNQGDFVLQRRNGQTVWSAGTANSGNRLFVQSDGNVIVRRSDNKAVWTSKTYDHPGAQLIVDDGGQIAVAQGNLAIWLDGIPRGVYTGRPGRNLEFPVRGLFYYPWYPETWTVNGKRVRYVPDLGLYSNSDPSIFEAHIEAFEYAWTDLIICSWWGPNTNQDRGRITMMLDELTAAGSNVKLSFYHEDERDQRPTPAQIKADMDYLKKWYAWHPAFAHVDDRPVIFVFNRSGCEIAERWMAASNNEWYVVLKLFPGFEDCAVQPDHWHQYGVGDGDPLSYRGYSTTIAPGFWRADLPSPLLPRLSKAKFCDNVRVMVDNNEPWQLVVSFNEHGEATGVESTPNWDSSSGYGYYLDCLHQYY